MYVVLGASGNTGHVVAKNLLAREQKVRVVGRNAAHLQSLAAEGAEIFISDVLDANTLTKAFQKADAAYVMIPPNPASNDVRAYEDRVSDAIAVAVQNAGVKHVVSLSSFGADKPSGTGPVVGLHDLEQKLNQINGANVLHLRAGYFMENTLPQVGAIRMLGSMIGPVSPHLKLPMIATRDIGAAAADALLRLAFQGKQAQELQGQRDLDYTEAATIIGKAIGKPDLGYIQAPDNQVRAAMVQTGMSDNFAGLILEMAGALNSGHMRALEPRSTTNTTPTKFETFVAESFVPAYQQQAARKEKAALISQRGLCFKLKTPLGSGLNFHSNFLAKCRSEKLANCWTRFYVSRRWRTNAIQFRVGVIVFQWCVLWEQSILRMLRRKRRGNMLHLERKNSPICKFVRFREKHILRLAIFLAIQRWGIFERQSNA
jgi:uncharacterized protein YbjT (DUF2867 family)